MPMRKKSGFVQVGTPLKPPYPEGREVAEFALGCFWGEERTFWQVQPGLTGDRLEVRPITRS
jgi:peptide-methionine (S)-S-oxide reductase